ncbi:hypothetical protein T8A63_07300 [Sulfitobacter sp. OXR-159]|uniref:hypothetical protein n=1 Tax=Sulfitobacter sp. OXR-159 TaxID=3100174 RepID=UPI002AC8D4B3|nr:hypothetical protein [Sulfitobacter sp. OXR-159]WPZ30761.1 hypothetical protein T8A63_06790 [Sulfitobacter sp. OXR-159]WPZ30862.1 hypothetical protein T8A63_07300 [Sulfitobacter sp. OXR-159]
MADESNPWQGVALVPEQPRATQPPVERRSPLDERTLNQAEVLAGLRGDKSEHAVRFKDLENLKREVAKEVAGVGKYGDTGSGRTGSVGEQIAAQFAAIDTESKALLKDYNKLFDQAMEGIETLGTEVDGKFDTFQTELDGNSTAISSLIVSVDGVKAQYGIRINNNGHISGFGLLSRLINGQPVSDFIINDATFRIVNSSGQGNFTPFAVYPTGRYVGGEYIPAGVHAQDLYVTNANIGDAQIDTAKIKDLSVDTLKIAGNAVTGASYTKRTTSLAGNGSLRPAISGAVDIPPNTYGDVVVVCSLAQGYTSGPKTWGFRLETQYGLIIERFNMEAINDYPTISAIASFNNTTSNAITLIVALLWNGEDSTVELGAQTTMNLIGRWK